MAANVQYFDRTLEALAPEVKTDAVTTGAAAFVIPTILPSNTRALLASLLARFSSRDISRSPGVACVSLLILATAAGAAAAARCCAWIWRLVEWL